MHIDATVPYPAGARTYKINTPSRKKEGVNKSLATTVLNFESNFELYRQQVLEICSEMKHLSSEQHSSILADKKEALKFFNWEMIMQELEFKLPTLIVFA